MIKKFKTIRLRELHNLNNSVLQFFYNFFIFFNLKTFLHFTFLMGIILFYIVDCNIKHFILYSVNGYVHDET